MNKPRNPNEPIGYVTLMTLGYLNSVRRYSAKMRIMGVKYGDYTQPLYLEPPPMTDESAALILAAIDLLRNSKNENHKQWVAHARKSIRSVVQEAA